MKGMSISNAWNAVLRFFLAPAESTPLAVLRIGMAAVLLVQAALVAPAYFGLYDRAGFLQGPVQEDLAKPGLPTLTWLVEMVGHHGASDAPVLGAIAALYLLSLVALMVGFCTRIAAAIAWFIHLTLMTSGNASNYGADMFANIFLFYLIWMPSGDALSIDCRLSRPSRGPTWGARLGLRVAQLHLCIVYFTTGLAKAKGMDWWNGKAIWESLTLPDFHVFDFTWLASHPWLAMVMGWGVLGVELGYAVFVWPRRTRLFWVALTVGLHLGIMIFMGLHIFGAIMIVFTTAAFTVSAEPKVQAANTTS